MTDALRCTARSSRTGRPCRNYAMAGTTVCRSHGAGAGQVRRAAARRIAQEQAARMLADVEVTPIDDPLLELERLAAEALRDLS